MYKSLGALCCLASLSACQSLATAPESVAGCYAATDGIGYNRLHLCLSPGGSYTSRLVGDIGSRGEASGTWTLSGNMVQLVAKSESEQQVGLLAAVRVVSRNVLEPLAPSGEVAWEPLQRESP